MAFEPLSDINLWSIFAATLDCSFDTGLGVAVAAATALPNNGVDGVPVLPLDTADDDLDF